jgi:hypothetical protein
LVTAQARLNDAGGRLLAHGSATCALIDRRPAQNPMSQSEG